MAQPYQYQDTLLDPEHSYPSPETASLRHADLHKEHKFEPTSGSRTRTSPSPNLGNGTNKRVFSRAGARERRTDKEPRVYAELPSFPKFNDPVPDEATLEELCMKYPNHLRGSYLDAFVQWHWSAKDIHSLLTDAALLEFREQGINRSNSYNNRANFLHKRLEARLRGMTPEAVRELCTAPKIRGCMMDGTERYGASKLQGKFHNPHAQPLRSYPERKGRTKAEYQTLKMEASVAESARRQEEQFHLGETRDIVEEYKTAMANHWTQQRACSEAILFSDAHFHSVQPSERNRLLLQMALWPVSVETETFFEFDEIRQCPAFIHLVCAMIEITVGDIISSDVSQNPQPTPLDRRRTLLQHAMALVLAAQQAQTSKLESLALGLGGAAALHRKKFGLVQQALSATQDFGVDDDALANGDILFNESNEVSTITSTEQSDVITKFESRPNKRCREDEEVDTHSSKQARSQGAPMVNWADSDQLATRLFESLPAFHTTRDDINWCQNFRDADMLGEPSALSMAPPEDPTDVVCQPNTCPSDLCFTIAPPPAGNAYLAKIPLTEPRPWAEFDL